jgi:hypothetical protein
VSLMLGTTVKNRKFRPRLAFGLCGLIVVDAAAAYFFGSHRTGWLIAGQAVFCLCIAYGAYQRDRARNS